MWKCVLHLTLIPLDLDLALPFLLQYVQWICPCLLSVASLGCLGWSPAAGHRLGAVLLLRHQSALFPTPEVTIQHPSLDTKSLKRLPKSVKRTHEVCSCWCCTSCSTGLPLRYVPIALYPPATPGSLISFLISRLRLMMISQSQLGFSLRLVTVSAGSSCHKAMLGSQ